MRGFFASNSASLRAPARANDYSQASSPDDAASRVKTKGSEKSVTI